MTADRPQDATAASFVRLIDDQTPRDSVLARVYKVLDASGGRAAVVPLKLWMDVSGLAARLSVVEAENAALRKDVRAWALHARKGFMEDEIFEEAAAIDKYLAKLDAAVVVSPPPGSPPNA